MKVAHVLHCGLLITDLERAKQFYGELLGLQQKPRPNFRFPGVWYDLGALDLHLIVTPEPLPRTDERRERDQHLAFAIEDFEGTKQKLIAAGIPFSESSQGFAQIFVRDPDGNLIELQKLPQ